MPTADPNNLLVRIELPAIRTVYAERDAGYVIARLYYNRRYAEWHWYLLGRSESYATWQGVSNVNAYPGRRLARNTSRGTPSHHMTLALQKCLEILQPPTIQLDLNVLADWERELLDADFNTEL